MKFRKRIILVGLLVCIPLILFAFSSMGLFLNRKLERVEKDWETLHKGFESYGIDRCGMYYPPDTVERRKLEPGYPLTFELSPDFIKSRPVNYDHKPLEHWIPLTTPIAYAKEIPRDPFKLRGFYGYSCWNGHNRVCSMAFLHSPGPDGKDDISPLNLHTEIETYLRTRGSSTQLLPEEYGAFKSMILPYQYDPTNGTKSSGDLIWLMDYAYQVYGWRKQDVKRWMEAPLSELPLYTEEKNSGVQGDWDVGDPLPPAQSMIDNFQRNKMIQIPDTLSSVMRITHSLKLIPDVGYQIDMEALSGVQNQFGRNFSAFFEAPRPLSSGEIKSLENWQETQINWWRYMDMFRMDKVNFSSLPAHEVYIFLPLFGKSQILLAACEAAEGNPEKALNRIESLTQCLHFIKERNQGYKGEPDPYEERVDFELNRLCLELKNNLEP